jgi:hypothetical protein
LSISGRIKKNPKENNRHTFRNLAFESVSDRAVGVRSVCQINKESNDEESVSDLARVGCCANGGS